MRKADPSLNPYASAAPAPHETRAHPLAERAPLADLIEGVFLGVALCPLGGLIAAAVLFVLTASEGFSQFVELTDGTVWERPPPAIVLYHLASGGVLGACVVGMTLGAIAGLFIALQPRLTRRGLTWQMLGPAALLAVGVASYIPASGWWPFRGHDLDPFWHLLLATCPALLLFLAGLVSLSKYKLADRTQYFDADAAAGGFAAELVLASWARRKWRVRTPEGEFLIDYRPMSLWEQVLVNNRIAVQQFSLSLAALPRLEFPLGPHHGVIEVRTWLWPSVRWLMFRVDDRSVYAEGTPP